MGYPRRGRAHSPIPFYPRRLGPLGKAASGSTPISADDAGAGSDTSTVAAAITGSDTGAGTDTSSLNAAITASDSATGTDTATVDTSTQKAGADTGAGTDTGSLTAAATASDTASATDTASVQVLITGTDNATAADLASLAAQIAAASLATAVDNASVVVTGAYTPIDMEPVARVLPSARGQVMGPSSGRVLQPVHANVAAATTTARVLPQETARTEQ